MTPPRPVHTLDDLADDPRLAAELPAEAALQILVRVSALLPLLAVRAAVGAGNELSAPRNGKDPDQLLTAEEAGEYLHVSKQFFYRHGRKLGLAVPLSPGRLRYSKDAIDKYVQSRKIKT
ncbi:MAG: helix-turn-helix domain-containing protein [Planctomycetes bacterium]|nr:helix-turn-helix domain-containing protein [Planctomycetota bacterium]